MLANADDLRDQRTTVRDARSQLVSQQQLLGEQKTKLTAQLAQMKSQQPKLEAALGSLRAARADLQAKLEAAEKLAASPTPPPGIAQAVAQLKGAIAQLDGKLVALETGLGQLKAAIPQIEAGLAKMQTGEVAMADARTKIADALSQMADGIDQLENAHDVMRVAARAQAVGVDIARFTREQTTLRAPADGLVLSALPAGQLAMVNAPVVVIRPLGAVLVDVYLAPDVAARVKAGDSADVTTDSLSETFAGRVQTVWPMVQFPPNNYPTTVTHMANAVRVTVAVEDDRLPVGVPADVAIHPSR